MLRIAKDTRRIKQNARALNSPKIEGHNQHCNVEIMKTKMKMKMNN
jgi:hypothetical protein